MNEYDKKLIRKAHKFIRNENDEDGSYEDKLALKEYKKLYKQYCLVEFIQTNNETNSNFEVGLRWRTKKDVISGKGVVSCGNLNCNNIDPELLDSFQGSVVIANTNINSDSLPFQTIEALFEYQDGIDLNRVPIGQGNYKDSKKALVKLHLCNICLKRIPIQNSNNIKNNTEVDIDTDAHVKTETLPSTNQIPVDNIVKSDINNDMNTNTQTQT